MGPAKNLSSPLASASLSLFLLFFLLPDFISSNPSPHCNGRNRSKEIISLHFSFFDQFGDEASALHDGGGLNLSCRHQKNKQSALKNCHNWFLHFYHNNSKLASRSIAEPFLSFNSSSSPTQEQRDGFYNGKYSLGCSCCSAEEEGVGRLHVEGKICDPLEGEVCSTDGVCLLKNGKKTCERKSLLQENGAQYTSQDGYNPCFGNKIRGNTWLPEYKQFGKDLEIWPRFETRSAHFCTDPKYYKKREYRGRFIYQHFFPITEAIKTIHVTKDLQEQYCIGTLKFSCHLDILPPASTVAKEIELPGNCKTGYIVDVKEIWNASRAKIVCFNLLQSNKESFEARWEFHVLPFVVRVREKKDGKGKECVWPAWVHKEPSDLEGGECRHEGKTLQKTLSYPPPLAGTVLTFKTLFPEETTTPSLSTEAPTERPSRVPKWLRVLPIVFLGVGVVQALPFLLYYGYWECVSWEYRRKLRREERLSQIKEEKARDAGFFRDRWIKKIRDPSRFDDFSKS